MLACVSNIAWTAADDEAAHELLRAAGVRHLEIAPTRRWPDLAQVQESEARAEADRLRDQGFSVQGFQALLFGKPELTLFGPDRGEACLSYLAKVCRLANWMGAHTLVFGSPKNRLRGELSGSEAWEQGRTFFGKLARLTEAENVVVCLEPNPPAYGCDFLTTVTEAAEMVAAVDSPGIRLNVDMGELILNQQDASAVLPRVLSLAAHFHASEPNLEPFDPARSIHAQAAIALRQASYAGAVSLEMKTPAGGLPGVATAVRDMLRTYFDPAR